MTEITARRAGNGDLAVVRPSRDRFGLVVGEADLPGIDAYETTNPATGEPLARVSVAGPQDVNRAVELAVAAQPGWAALDPLARQALIHAFADRVKGAKDELALLETLDNGMPLRSAEANLDRAVDQLRFSASCVLHIAGQRAWTGAPEQPLPGVHDTPSRRRRRSDHSLEQPAGVSVAEDLGGARGGMRRGAQAGSRGAPDHDPPG